MYIVLYAILLHCINGINGVGTKSLLCALIVHKLPLKRTVLFTIKDILTCSAHLVTAVEIIASLLLGINGLYVGVHASSCSRAGFCMFLCARTENCSGGQRYCV